MEIYVVGPNGLVNLQPLISYLMIEEIRHKSFLHEWLLPLPGMKLSFIGKFGRSIGKRLFSKSQRSLHLENNNFKKDLEKIEKYELLFDFIQKSRSCGANYIDYSFIYNYITLKKPKVVLELGSGISSLVFAMAAKKNAERNHTTQVFSIESDEFYWNDLMKNFPSDLREYVSFSMSKTNEVHLKSASLCNYEEIPENTYDFVYVDGPPTNGFLCSDIINICSQQKQSFDFLTNKRLKSVELYNRIFRSGSIYYDYINGLGGGREINSHSPSSLKNDVNVKNGDIFELFELK